MRNGGQSIGVSIAGTGGMRLGDMLDRRGVREAVDIMGRLQLGKTFTDAENAKVVAFLKTLTGDQPSFTLPILPPSSDKTPRPKPFASNVAASVCGRAILRQRRAATEPRGGDSLGGVPVSTSRISASMSAARQVSRAIWIPSLSHCHDSPNR